MLFMNKSELTYKDIDIPPFFMVGLSYYRAYFIYFALACALPFAALVLTSFFEYSINKTGVSLWMNNKFSFLLFNGIISFMRFYAIGAIIGISTWLSGSVILAVEKPKIKNCVRDAIIYGWKNAIRISIAFLLFWLILSIYSQILLVICKGLWVFLAPVSLTAATLSVALTVIWATIPPAILLGKFIFAIHLIVFEEMPGIIAINFASKLVTFKSVVWEWPVLMVFGALFFIFAFLPSYGYIDSFVAILSSPHYSPLFSLKAQIISAVWIFLFCPLATVTASLFYFMNSPRYWDFSDEEKVKTEINSIDNQSKNKND